MLLLRRGISGVYLPFGCCSAQTLCAAQTTSTQVSLAFAENLFLALRYE